MKSLLLCLILNLICGFAQVHAEGSRTRPPAFTPFFQPKVTKSDLALQAAQEKSPCIELLLGNGQDAEVFARLTNQEGTVGFKAVKIYRTTKHKDGLFNAAYDTDILVAAKKHLRSLLKPFRLIEVYDVNENFVELELVEGETLLKLIENFGPDNPHIQALLGRYRLAYNQVRERATAAGLYTFPLQDGAIVEGIGIRFKHRGEALELLIHWTNILVDAKTGELIINDPQ